MNRRRHGQPVRNGFYTLPERVDHIARIAALEEEVCQLREAIGSHAVIDQAAGVVMALGGLSPQQGFDTVKAVSQDTNIKMRVLAEMIVDWVSDGRLPDEVRTALDLALVKARRV